MPSCRRGVIVSDAVRLRRAIRTGIVPPALRSLIAFAGDLPSLAEAAVATDGVKLTLTTEAWCVTARLHKDTRLLTELEVGWRHATSPEEKRPCRRAP